MQLEKSQSPVAVFPFFVFVVVLVVAILAGESPASRLGAASGLAGGLLAAVAVGRKFQSELETTFIRGLWAGITRAWVVWTAFALLMAILTTGLKGPVAILVSVVTIAGIFALGAWPVLREGVDREVFLRSSSFAFFMTMLVAVGAALYEVLADGQRLSMWVLWSVGMLTWAIATAVFSTRYR